MIPLEDLLARLRADDSFTAIEMLCRDSDSLGAVKLFNQVMNHLYWKEKDLPAAMAMGRAGVQHGLTAAERIAATDAAVALELRGQAKAMAYNLASFTWPGWDEAGIVIGPSDLAVGLDAARANLRLGTELNRGPLPISRAHWMLAAHELAAGKYDAARANFSRAWEQAEAAGEDADRLLSVGFGILTELLFGKNDSDGATQEAENRLKETEAQLRPLEHGEMFIQQIQTARRVFGKETSR